MCINVCIIKIQVRHEVKNQRAIAERTSQIMKYAQDVIIQNGHMYNTRCSRKSKHILPHAC